MDTNVLRQRAAAGALALALLGAPVLVGAAAPEAALSVPVRDTIRGESEDIVFSGKVSIAGELIDDPDFRSPMLLQLRFDFSQVKGVGVASGKTYLTASQTVLHRPLLASDRIQASFPYYPANNPSAARSAVASFSIVYSS